MSRFLSFSLLIAANAVTVVGGLTMGACGSADAPAAARSDDAGTVRRDAAPVDPVEAGPALDAGSRPPPSCAKYCNLVMDNCTGENAQYSTVEECLAFCKHLPLVQSTRESDEKTGASVACRQYWADGPARTSPESYCLAAGPFGGNACGDRCTAFCGVALSACSPDGGVAAYATLPECATACAGFSFRDAADGGGEGPYGPDGGDSLNCRLFWLRAATVDPQSCPLIGAASSACKDD